MWKYEIRLGNGEIIRDSVKDYDEAYDTEDEAKIRCEEEVNNIIENDDSEDEDKWTEGDFRTYTTEFKTNHTSNF